MTKDELKCVAEAFEIVAVGKGLEVCDDEIAICGSCLDNYMLVYVLSQMIANGDCEISIKGDKSDYVRKLIGLQNKER